jgi:glycerophosphoryl diester phosphodiesterase
LNSKILKIGHRGAMGYVPENTIESIKRAMELGVDGIEIDVHKCASGELVVFHDFTLDRITNALGEVSKQPLSDLKKIKVKENYEIPILQEVLDLINKKCLINIELKGKNTAQKTTEVIQHYVTNNKWNYNDFLVSSFQHKELKKVYKLNKSINIGILTKASIAEAIEFAETIKAKAIHPNVALVTSENIKIAQQKGFQVNVWTVNDFETILRMKDYNVNGIISDFPDRL